MTASPTAAMPSVSRQQASDPLRLMAMPASMVAAALSSWFCSRRIIANAANRPSAWGSPIQLRRLATPCALQGAAAGFGQATVDHVEQREVGVAR